MRVFILYTVILLTGCSSENRTIINQQEFAEIAEDISHGWSNGDARQAAQYFADDAVYEEPPGKQLYKGKKEIFEFFGGEQGFDIPMKMEWHNLAFDERKQIGFGEYTFAMNNQYHGIVIMQFENSIITKWREYQVESPLEWEEFVRESEFKTFP